MLRGIVLCALFAALVAASPVAFARDFVAFESGPVRPIVLSPDGSRIFVTNIPDNRLEIFSVSSGGITHTGSVPVGLEPVAVAARNDDELWVVNHLSDSVSIVDLSATPPRVSRTLLVGDEPRDIVFAGNGGNRAFITTAHRGQQRSDPSIGAVTGSGDPQLTTEGIGRADVWVFDAASLGATIGGTPVEILSFFADTPRALATDGTTVYVAAFHSGNESTVILEASVCNGFDLAGPCNVGGAIAPGGVPGPDDNVGGNSAPESGLIVKLDRPSGEWRDVLGRDWSSLVRLDLPDQDVFAVNANTLAHGTVFSHVGTVLFNMAINPSTGMLYVTNTESRNETRFEGPGSYAGSTVQGHLAETRISVLNPGTGSVDPQHLNQHIDYSRLHTDTPDLLDTTARNHSLATPLQIVVSGDGSTLYVAALGSAKIGVFDAADVEDASFEANFVPSTESANYLATGGGPAGLALDEVNGRIYVMTRFDNSVASIDLATGSTLQTLPLHNPEPSTVVNGRPVLYDAFATSANGEASCASCHIFADFDSLAWNLGDPDASASSNPQPLKNGQLPNTPFHPMKGPMTTQTLRGLGTHGAMHWRGDRSNGFFGLDPCNDASGSACDEAISFNNFIVAFEGLVGHDGRIATSEMNAFTDFILELFQPPNPVRALDNMLSPQQALGASKYLAPNTDASRSCEDCHRIDPSQGLFGTDGEQSLEGEPQNFKIAHLRNAYQKVGMFGISAAAGIDLGPQVRGTGYLHDGAADTVKNFLAAAVFTLTNQEERDIEAFIFAFPSDLAPIVGQQVTLDASNGGVVNSRIDLMLTQAQVFFDSLMLGGGVTECDVVVKGSVGGVPRGWRFDSSSGLYEDDLGSSISDASLRALASSEGPLTFTAVPPGSGRRIGIDRDRDTLLDGVETDTGVFLGPGDTGTNPALADTDGDGFDDGREVARGSDPTDPLSFPAAHLPALQGPAALAYPLLLLAVAVGALRRRQRSPQPRRREPPSRAARPTI